MIQDYPMTRMTLRDLLNIKYPGLEVPCLRNSASIPEMEDQIKLGWMLSEMEGMTDELKLARWIGYALRLAENLKLLTNLQSQSLIRVDIRGQHEADALGRLP